MAINDGDWTSKQQARSRLESQFQRESFHELHKRQVDHTLFVKDQHDWIDAGTFNVDTLTRLRFFTTITGSINNIPWLSMAQQKAKHAYLIGCRNWHHEFNIGLVAVAIDLRGRNVYVRISGGGEPGIYFRHEPQVISPPDQAILARSGKQRYKEFVMVDDAWPGFAAKNFRALGIPILNPLIDPPNRKPWIDERRISPFGSSILHSAVYNKTLKVHVCIQDSQSTIYIGGGPVLTSGAVSFVGARLYGKTLAVAYIRYDGADDQLCVEYVTRLGYYYDFTPVTLVNITTIPHCAVLGSADETVFAFHPTERKGTWLSAQSVDDGVGADNENHFRQYTYGRYAPLESPGDVEAQMIIEENVDSLPITISTTRTPTGPANHTRTVTMETVVDDTVPTGYWGILMPPAPTELYSYDYTYSYSFTYTYDAPADTLSLVAVPIHTGYDKDGVRYVWRVNGDAQIVASGTFSENYSDHIHTYRFDRDHRPADHNPLLSEQPWLATDDQIWSGSFVTTTPTVTAEAHFEVQIYTVNDALVEDSFGDAIVVMDYAESTSGTVTPVASVHQFRKFFAGRTANQYTVCKQRPAYAENNIELPVPLFVSAAITYFDGTTWSLSYGPEDNAHSQYYPMYSLHQLWGDDPRTPGVEDFIKVNSRFAGFYARGVTALAFQSVINERGAEAYSTGIDNDACTPTPILDTVASSALFKEYKTSWAYDFAIDGPDLYPGIFPTKTYYQYGPLVGGVPAQTPTAYFLTWIVPAETYYGEPVINGGPIVFYGPGSARGVLGPMPGWGPLPGVYTGTEVVTIDLSYKPRLPFLDFLEVGNQLHYGVVYDEYMNKHCVSPYGMFVGDKITVTPVMKNIVLLGEITPENLTGMEDITATILTAKLDYDETATLPQSPDLGNNPSGDDFFDPRGLI